MNITRHTYEEFFILYMDNELSVEDRKAVEAFADQHPDLKDELDLLMQTKISADHEVMFSDKESLLKYSNTNSIHEANSHEWLLIYIDNELNSADLKSAEKLIASNSSISKELDLLLKVKMQPEENIVFAKKESLYRREERTPIVLFQWKRIAVAAAIVFAIATGAFFVLKNNYNADGGGGSSLANTKKEIVPTVIPNKEIEKQNVVANKQVVPVEKVKYPVKENFVVVPQKREESRVQTKRFVAPEKESQTLLATNEEKKNNALPKPVNNPNVNAKVTDVTNATAKNNITAQEALTNQKEIKRVPIVTTETPQPLYTSNTSMQSSDDNIEVEQPGKKNKLRGFFRKVTRTFERTTNIKATDDEDRLLLGSLAIKL